MIFFLPSSCSFDYGPSVDAEPSEKIPNSVVYAYEHVIVENSMPLMRVSASKASIFDKVKKTIAEGLSYTEYDRKTGKPATEGTAANAEYFSDSGNAELTGGIKLFLPGEDITFETRSLSWNDKNKIADGRLDQVTTITRSDGTLIRGSGFQANAQTRSLIFRGHAEGTIVVKDEEKKKVPAAESPPEAELTRSDPAVPAEVR
jgi:LPS export ABC transporter protein LptC